VLDSPSAFTASTDDIRVEVALWWSRDAHDEEIKCFTNAIRQLDGGTHLSVSGPRWRAWSPASQHARPGKKMAITGEDARGSRGGVVGVDAGP
jgi:DNA gyrase/topoisomerase IV subunit B